MDKLDLSKKSLRKFGITMGIIFLAIAIFVFTKYRYIIVPIGIVSALFFIFAAFIPIALKPIYIFWMKLAFVLAWINTRIILIALFYLIFTPIGLAMKIFGTDLLERKIDKKKKSYWKQKEKAIFNPLNYEKQF